MTDAAALALQVIQTLAVLVGVVFGLIQLRQIKHQQEAAAGAAMLQSLQSTDAGSTALLLVELPDDLPGGELKQRLGGDFDRVIALASMFESVGPLVARGQVPIDIYADFYRGATVLCWRKLRRYIAERRNAGWTNLFEWFEWLSDQMDRRTPLHSDVPASVAFAEWRSAADFDRLQSRR